MDTVNTIKAMGLRVFTRPDYDESRTHWLYFTDGDGIGYLEYHRFDGYKVGTVHKPNHNTGTGFEYQRNVETLTKDLLTGAFYYVPEWASYDSFEKWKDWKQFHNADQWTREYIER